MRPHTDDADIIGTKPKQDLGPLFAHCKPAEAERELREEFVSPPPRIPLPPVSSATERDSDRDAIRDRVWALVEPRLLARAEARRDLAESPGVTADDVRQIAAAAGLGDALGQEQRAWSWVAGRLKRLASQGLLAEYRIADDQPVRRRSTRDGAHGNALVVYLDPRDHRARTAA